MEMATTIIENIWLMDLAVCYGSDKFLILLPETDLESAREVAERLRENVEKELDATMSIGVACYLDSLTKDDIIVNTDNPHL